MRRRYGRISADGDSDAYAAVGEMSGIDREVEKSEGGKVSEKADSGMDTKSRVYSWFDVVRAGAQLTLDVMRVMREATDLYRKLSGGRGGAGT